MDIQPLPCLYPVESYKDSAITLRDPPRLHLPLKLTVNDVFQIQIDQHEQTNYESIVIRSLFKIEALYLSMADYRRETFFEIGRSYSIGYSIGGLLDFKYGVPENVFKRYRRTWEDSVMNVLNQTQYLLSIPLEEIPLHLEEVGIMKDLVMWRLDLPRDYGCLNPIGTFSCNI